MEYTSMRNTYFKSAEYNAICDRCGFKFKSSQLMKTWEGFMVCQADWEPRNIIDFIKAPKPIPAIPWSRPEGADVEVGPTYISTTIGSQDTIIPVANSGNGSTL
jgi:hypothetical protein